MQSSGGLHWYGDLALDFIGDDIAQVSTEHDDLSLGLRQQIDTPSPETGIGIG
jgi:hypothetical protein